MQSAIVDFNAGNLTSIQRMAEYVGSAATIARTPEEVLAADRLILPGVGAAPDAMATLKDRGLDEAMDEAVNRRGRPLLGICLGMQLLAQRLTEFGEHTGLGWIPGAVLPLGDVVSPGVRVPQMGWNEIIATRRGATLLDGVRGEKLFYFSHSYAFVPTSDEVVAATVDYGGPVVAAILRDNIFATQFHPEKSQVNGEVVIAAFLQWSP